MNFLKKGPELKLSELHVPNFAFDLYYDLKERHLLPLVAVLLIAMIGIPIYSSATSGSEEEPIVAVPAISTEEGASALTVGKAEPGLRDPHKRLKHARALDPFGEQDAGGESASETETSGEGSAPAAAVPTEASVIGGESASSPTPGEPTGSVETYVPPVSAGGGETEVDPGAGGGGRTVTRYVSNAIDVRIVAVPKSGKEQARKAQAKAKVEVRRDLPELTMLPARATPAATFMGTTRDGKKALLLVSSDVESLFGEAKCILGSQTCQLLALEKGSPETFVYGPQERTFRIELLRIRRTVGAQPRRAPLGTPKHKAHGGGSSSGGAGATQPAER